ncbi:MAG: hypothetical protein F6J90_00815 [Moorea sp. SIOASIH]|uniref:hypothetical protein n=1 Tax=Moorena sp. SIOASIH TaxID=2607817 RepID=UPI0013B7E491|nr:hypothetical protein [Moorena sp. SIOASIH]NEO34921.1 hypothetical protein [Moorena sp. SIOASIH]NEO95485.1 hypothetical protein [Moorena sp. SIO3G5]
MTNLFRRLNPAKKFRITVYMIARLLKISYRLIVRVEFWNYVIFVHRRDRGGQFISYRKLSQWQNAVACQIQQCTTLPALKQLWFSIETDCHKYSKQYSQNYYHFIWPIWRKQWDRLWQQGNVP